MPGMMTAPPMGAPKPTNLQFNSGTPGGGAQVAGYNSALQNLQKSIGLSQNTSSAQQMQLGQQLQNNQASVGQSLTNRGLGNTTVANTMQQAPLQTYNMGMAQVQNQDALRQMMGYQNLAGAQMQGGQQISQMNQPYQMMNLQNMMQQQNQNGMYASNYAAHNPGFGQPGSIGQSGMPYQPPFPGAGGNSPSSPGNLNYAQYLSMNPGARGV